METKSILLIILIMPLYGIGIGLHLDIIDKGEMFHLQDLINNAGLQVRDNSFLDNAFMNVDVHGPISSASIDLVLDKVLVDDDGMAILCRRHTIAAPPYRRPPRIVANHLAKRTGTDGGGHYSHRGGLGGGR